MWAAAAVSAFRFPRVDPPAHTEAYYFLASNGGTSGLHLGLEKVPTDAAVVISVTESLAGLPDYQAACARTDREVHCVTPDPLTTQGEARTFTRLAHEQRWQSVTVISQLSHTTRTRILMERCYSGTILLNPVDMENTAMWLMALVYESGAMVKTWLTPGC